MDLSVYSGISPCMRVVKIVKTELLSGEWVDDDNVFTYIEQGEADFILNGVKYKAVAGDVIVMPPFMHHIIKSTSDIPRCFTAP